MQVLLALMHPNTTPWRGLLDESLLVTRNGLLVDQVERLIIIRLLGCPHLQANFLDLVQRGQHVLQPVKALVELGRLIHADVVTSNSPS